VVILAAVLAAAAGAEQASDSASPAAAQLDAGGLHSCAFVSAGGFRCWGLGFSGQLGYGNTDTIGDDETPASVGPVSFGPGLTATAIAAGDYHTCAILDDGSVRCWGFGAEGRLGYGNTNDVLDPSSAGPVDIGPGRIAVAISAGAAHTCVILDDGSVRCWGYNGGGYQDGRLGNGSLDNIGDTPATIPGQMPPVNLGAGRTAIVISAGGDHTCVILEDHSVLCWGLGTNGQLGYGNIDSVGYDPTNTPNTVGPVNLGGHTAKAISAGGSHTCVILDDNTVRCWGLGASGQIGYGTTSNGGDTPATTPNNLPPVNLGPGRTAVAISAGGDTTCAILDDGTVRCWGLAAEGRLGYPTLDNLGNQANVLDPSTVGPLDLGPGRTALAISVGLDHTCARLDDGSVRCWGHGAEGQNGYCSTETIGDNETPGSVGPVNLVSGDGGTTCPVTAMPPGGAGSPPAGSSGSGQPGGGGSQTIDALTAEALRAKALRECLRQADRQPRRRRARARRSCRARYGRTPGPITKLSARATSSTVVVLTFGAPGSDGIRPPAARSYLVRQSRHWVRRGRTLEATQTVCHGSCRFKVTLLGTTIELTITHLHPHTTYDYTVAARDNVSGRLGPRSKTIKVRTP
jgi:alpha-tubulin suppressor-like RCC1 family protein